MSHHVNSSRTPSITSRRLDTRTGIAPLAVSLLALSMSAVGVSVAGPATCIAETAPPAVKTDGPFTIVPLPQGEDGLTLEIRIASTPNGCTWGDFDAIRSDLAGSTNPRLLATLEPLTGGGAAQVKDISSFDLTKGFVAKFSVPKTGASHYALYLCKDSEKKDRCGSKPLVPPQAVLSAHMTEIDRKTGKPIKEPKEGEASDKVYYFAYLFVDKGTVAVMKSGMASADFTAASAYLSKNGAAPSVMKLVEDKLQPMDSVQPTVINNKLTVLLPQVDQSACPH